MRICGPRADDTRTSPVFVADDSSGNVGARTVRENPLSLDRIMETVVSLLLLITAAGEYEKFSLCFVCLFRFVRVSIELLPCKHPGHFSL
jgi:hypothetical protein